MLIGRHSFIRQSKLSDVAGRIDYISNPKRQEYLYATYQTEGATQEFWKNLAKENQLDFKASGSAGKCIEGREFIIALPESFVRYRADDVVRLFTETFHKRYGVECSATLHHNKTKTNYHIHLVFSERKMLEQPEVKIATRNMFYDEQGKHRRTKKEILDEQGNIRAGCSIIPKGEVYESHIFTKKEEWFKNKAFTKEVKELFTDTINRYVKEKSERLSVFQQGGVYLATKKIGKNNPKAEEIKADNVARQEWNRTVDVALVEGVPEEDILKIKQEKITDKTLQSIRTHGWLPDMFRQIIRGAKDFLQEVIFKFKLPPRPVPKIDLQEWKDMQKIMYELQGRSREIKRTQQDISSLKKQLSELRGLFKGKERKSLEGRIEMLYWTGIREGELLALTPADFDFEKQTVSINKSFQHLNGRDIITSPKTEKSNRIIKMPKFLCDEIQEYLKMLYDIDLNDRMFPITKSYLYREMERGSKQAGMNRIRIHDIRHSHVSLLIDINA
ncbi:MAG: site-specific integrase [Lachnospirales bacterium]